MTHPNTVGRHPPLPSHSRNPRRAYDADGYEITPMTLQQATEKGVTKLRITCDCGHNREMPIYDGGWPSTSFVPDAGMTLRCGACSKPDPWTGPVWPAPPPQAALDLAANSQTGGPQI